MATHNALLKNALIVCLFTLTIMSETAFSQLCGKFGCEGNMCCSKWGFCGTTNAYCGEGCQSGPCKSQPYTPTPSLPNIPTPSLPNIPTPSQPNTPTPSRRGGLNAGPRGTIASVVTPALFNSIMSKVGSGCPAKGFYTRQAFIEAAQSFPAYRGAVAKREIAAILAQFSHESLGFCFKEEIARGRYCSLSLRYPCQPGKNYYGRGPIQITWNYNYGAAGRFLGLPLLEDPDMVARSPSVAFKCAMWFWNKNVRPVLSRGYGATTRRINKGECDGGDRDAVESRVNRYLDFCKKLGVTPGTNLRC